MSQLPEGDKVNFWLLTDEPFDQARFSRRKHIHALDVSFFVPTVEDTILAKLRWMNDAGGSERHFRDALRVFEVNQHVLDRTYIETWAAQLGISEYWQRILKEAEPL